jgi:hypothetical protein
VISRADVIVCIGHLFDSVSHRAAARTASAICNTPPSRGPRRPSKRRARAAEPSRRHSSDSRKSEGPATCGALRTAPRDSTGRASALGLRRARRSLRLAAPFGKQGRGQAGRARTPGRARAGRGGRVTWGLLIKMQSPDIDFIGFSCWSEIGATRARGWRGPVRLRRAGTHPLLIACFTDCASRNEKKTPC